MAVVQISRIQARRGLHQDLPALASAELGWSVDSRRLFIGNGTLAEGAPTEGITELLTQYSDVSAVLGTYNFKGNSGGYIAQTGSSFLNPTVRSYQDKLDETVSVKDFGATGDGVTDDTVAINRAITQIYKSTLNSTNPEVRRTIYFPAGTYVITGAQILIPPYARLVGDGISSTFIKQTDATQDSVIAFTDHLFQTGAFLGQNSATLPTDISIEHMTLQNTSDKDVCIIDSVTNAHFTGVAFKGILSNPTTAASVYTGVRVKSFAATTSNINFTQCKFVNTRYALVSDESSRNVRLTDCYIAQVYKGIKLGQNSVSTYPGAYRIFNTLFDSVANIGIECFAGVSGILSCGNSFNDVGSNFTSGVSDIAPVIYFLGDGNYSLGDSFGSKFGPRRVGPVSTRAAHLEANIGLALGTAVVGTGGNISLLDNQSIASNTGVVLGTTCTVNYSLFRGTAFRAGSMQYTTDGTNAYFVDNYTSSDTDAGVVLTIVANSINYTTTSTGSPATFRYNLNYFN